MSAFFITGTDTGCGKTAVTSALLDALTANHSAVGYKPVAAGCEHSEQGWQNDDALLLQAHSQPSPAYSSVNPYAFPAAIAPHIAAQQVGVEIDSSIIQQGFQQLQGAYQHVLVEGAGGWRVPLNQNLAISDLPTLLDIPVILVVGLKLGCINHATLSAESILNRGTRLAGWVANQIEPDMPAFEENLATLNKVLTEQLSVPLIAEFDYQSTGQPAQQFKAKRLNLEALLAKE